MARERDGRDGNDRGYDGRPDRPGRDGPGQFGKFTEAEVKAGTDTGTGRGNPKLHESSGIVDLPGYRTQTIKRAYPLDTSDMELPNETGMAGFKGAPDNLKHSLTGPSAVMGPNDGNESPYIPNH